MSEQEAIAFYRAQLVETARALPVCEATQLLRGALLVAGANEAVSDLRRIYIQLQHVEAQLELIANGQMIFDLIGGPQP